MTFMKKYILSFVGVLALALPAVAGTDYKVSKEVVVDNCKFRDSELQVDLFGLGAFYKQGRPGWGGGIGVNYFFARYFGIGVEQDLFGRNDNGSKGYTEWGTFGNAFLRYPICSWNLAPYAIVGGGVIYGKKTVGGGSVGGGLEYRVTDNVALFGDARWLYTEDNSAVMARTGIKLAF
jgi:hypothetical protein